MVEQGTENPRVVGSIPTGSTIFADLAHLVERHLAKVEVASSSLVIRSTVSPYRDSLYGVFVNKEELTMKVTSAEAAKILRKYQDELRNTELLESRSKEFLAAVGENIEEVRPQYDYAETQNKCDELEAKIRKLKHTINVFNSTQVVPGFDMTIDMVLVYLPQLSSRCEKLRRMQSILPKTRSESYNGASVNVIDYRYANYDIGAVKADYDRHCDLLARIQTALDTVNTTVEFEIDL